MKLQEFYYELPESLIAQSPLPDRAQARLMLIDRARQKIEHCQFKDLGQCLPKKSLLVLNDSKVIPARIYGIKERNGAQVEFLLLKQLSDGYTYEVLMRPMRKIRDYEKIIFPGIPLKAIVIDVQARLVKFSCKNLDRYLKKIGHIPLPPYIRRDDSSQDHVDYQTVYARHKGSVACPTAGLHFTAAHLHTLQSQGHEILKVTLHVGAGTFQPVEVDDITQHPMHEEKYVVSSSTWKRIEQAREKKQDIVSVGTTSCRVLEAVASHGQQKGETRIFIYPGYQFKVVNALITNFHLPYSTLLMLVYGFAGKPLMKKAYEEAVRHRYRFFSYGDAMIII